MSRELLKRVIAECGDDRSGSNITPKLYGAIAEYLSTPEPEPVAWIEVGHPMDGPYNIHLEEADAYLIAASPDLLEALEAINEELCYGISDSLDALKDVATAAINKARGINYETKD